MDRHVASLAAANALAQARMPRSPQEGAPVEWAPAIALDRATGQAISALNRNFWLSLPGIFAMAAGATLFFHSVLR